MGEWVAHRGQSASFPENTLQSIAQAIACGATAVEFDLQMTADHIPVVCHDISLERTAGEAINIAESNYEALLDYSVGEAQRLGGAFSGVRLPALREMVALLQQSPQVTAFVELKDESIAVFGIEPFVKPVAEALAPIAAQCVLIAYSLDALLLSRKLFGCPIGWIVHRWNEGDQLLAKQHGVDYLVTGIEHCLHRNHDFAADPWQWMVYETQDVKTAAALFAQGVGYVESNDICAVLDSLG
jgi:glycerophosphoryl diester phosphodiesterase